MLLGVVGAFILTDPTVTIMRAPVTKTDTAPDMPNIKPKKPVKTAPKTTTKPSLRAPQVLAYLKANPSFLSKYAAQLAQNDAAPKRVGNIFALQAARAGKAESKAGGLLRRLTQFTAIAKANADATAQAHTAVLALLAGAANAGAFRKALQGPFKAALGIHSARLMLIGPATTATTLSMADLNNLCPAAIWLGAIAPQHMPLFGPQATTLRSAALLRMGPENAPTGLLIMASEDASHFHAGQATTLLEFLRDAASLMIQPWAKG